MNIRRGDIYYADLSPVVGSEQGGLRPVLIIQNDVGNRYSPTVIAAAITSRMGKTRLPTHIDIYAERAGLAKDSVILLEQIRTLDKRRLKERMGHLDDNIMNEVNNAIAVSFGLGGILTPPDTTPAVPDVVTPHTPSLSPSPSPSTSPAHSPTPSPADPQLPSYAAVDDRAPASASTKVEGEESRGSAPNPAKGDDSRGFAPNPTKGAF